jgi:hypothetical protein
METAKWFCVDRRGPGEGTEDLSSSCLSAYVREQDPICEKWQDRSVFAGADCGVAKERRDEVSTAMTRSTPETPRLLMQAGVLKVGAVPLTEIKFLEQSVL